MCMDGLLIRVPVLRLRDVCTSTLVINLCKVGIGPQVCKPVINCCCCVRVFRLSFVIESVMQNQHMWQALPAQLAFSAFLSYDLVQCRLSPIPFRSQTLSMCMFSCSWLSRSQLHTASVIRASLGYVTPASCCPITNTATVCRRWWHTYYFPPRLLHLLVSPINAVCISFSGPVITSDGRFVCTQSPKRTRSCFPFRNKVMTP